MLNISIPTCKNMEIMPQCEKRLDFLVQLEGFVKLERNAKIEGFASIERMVKISVY